MKSIKSSDPIRGTRLYSALAASPPKRFLAGEDVLHPLPPHHHRHLMPTCTPPRGGVSPYNIYIYYLICQNTPQPPPPQPTIRLLLAVNPFEQITATITFDRQRARQIIIIIYKINWFPRRMRFCRQWVWVGVGECVHMCARAHV